MTDHGILLRAGAVARGHRRIDHDVPEQTTDLALRVDLTIPTVFIGPVPAKRHMRDIAHISADYQSFVQPKPSAHSRRSGCETRSALRTDLGSSS
jgi:hypothetical protein